MSGAMTTRHRTAPASATTFMGINLRGYLNINDYRYFGGQLGNKGSGINVKYAGDPYWGMPSELR